MEMKSVRPATTTRYSSSLMQLLVVCVLMVMVMVMVPQQVLGRRILVGGSKGWTNNVNYTQWAQTQHFYLGDWLFFVYDRYQMNVLEVNETDFETCNSDHLLANWTRGAGRDVVPLNQTKPRYFISGKGFCFSGMKLPVRVENPPLPPSQSHPANHANANAAAAAAARATSSSRLAFVVIVATLWNSFPRVI